MAEAHPVGFRWVMKAKSAARPLFMLIQDFRAPVRWDIWVQSALG